MLTKLQHTILELRVKQLDSISISNLLNINFGLLNAIEKRTNKTLNINPGTSRVSRYQIFERYLQDYASLNSLHQDTHHYKLLETTKGELDNSKLSKGRRFKKSKILF